MKKNWPKFAVKPIKSKKNRDHCGNECWQKSQFTMFVTPFPLSLNIVIDLVTKKSTRFNTNTTLTSVEGEGDYFWPKFRQDISSTIVVFTSQPNLIMESGVHSSLHDNCHHQVIIYAKFNLKVWYPPQKPA